MELGCKRRALIVTCYRSMCPLSSSDEAALTIPLLLRSLLLHLICLCSCVIFVTSAWMISTDDIPVSVTYYFNVIFSSYFYYEFYDYGNNDRRYGRLFYSH